MTGLDLDIACFGAAHTDITARLCDGKAVLASSNPVETTRSAGGVARNVASLLARLGRRTALISRLGGDGASADLLAGLRRQQIHTEQMLAETGKTTGSYTAVLDARGELVLGLADLSIYDDWPLEHLQAAARACQAAPVWFADCNLPAEGLKVLADQKPAGTLLTADTVSVAKAPRIAGLLDRLDMLFCNLDEARAVLRQPALELVEAGEKLAAAGLGKACITQGAGPVLLLAEGEFHQVTPLPARVRDVSGAGDAFIAATLWALADHSLRQAVNFGFAAAAITVEENGTAPEGLTLTSLNDHASRASS